MNWLRNFFSRLFGRNRGSGWDGFKAVDTVIVDKPEEFRDRNSA